MLSSNASPHAIPADVLVPHEIRALLLDDSTFDRARIRRMSGGTKLPLHLDEVGSIEELDRAVRDEAYDLILIDYRLPVGDGLVALDRIHHSPRNHNAGKIMITGNEGLGTAVEAMRAGCHDFLCKDQLEVEMLKAAMLNAMSVAQERALSSLQARPDYGQMIREGLVDALCDKKVQGSIASMMKQTFPDSVESLHRAQFVHENETFDAMLADLSDPDEFVFH